MATTLYMTDSAPTDPVSGSGLALHPGKFYTDRTTSGNAWFAWKTTSTSRGSGVVTGTQDTVTGPTSGLEFRDGSPGNQLLWFTPPLSADVTISGTITLNAWASESSMSANATISCKIWVLGADGTQGGTISNTSFGTELTTSLAAKNWTDAAPTSTVVHKGERIAIQYYFDDAGTMSGLGYTVSNTYNGTSAGASGDTYVTFNENLSFASSLSAPAGSKFYLTDVASDIDPNGASWTPKKLSLTRDDGYVTSTTTLDSSTNASLTARVTSSGDYLEWFTPQLTGFTLSGPIKVNVWMRTVSGGVYGTLYGLVSSTDQYGGSPVVYSGAASTANFNGTNALETSFFLYGDDAVLAAGSRLRVRMYWTYDHTAGAMSTGTNAYFDFGATGATQGDSYITLTESPTEYEPRKFIAVIT